MFPVVMPADLVRDTFALGKSNLAAPAAEHARSSSGAAVLPGNTLSIDRYLRYLMNNIALSGDENQGLSPLTANAGHFKLASKLAMTKTNIVEATGIIAEFYSVTRPDISFVASRDRNEFRISVATDGRSPSAAKLLEDLYLQALFQYCCWFADADLLPHRVSLRREAYDAESRSASFYMTSVRFGAAMTELVFPLGVGMLARQQTSDPLFELQMVQRHIERISEGRSGHNASSKAGIVVAVEKLLDGQAPSLGTVARRLNMSEATLRRRLRAHGTSLSAVSDRLRRRRALEMLYVDHKSTEQTAFELGYSEPSSFVRAFARWTGQTPASLREMLSNGSYLLCQSEDGDMSVSVGPTGPRLS